MANPYPITPRQLNLVDLSGSHLMEQGVYPDIKIGVIASYNVSGASSETVLKSTASGGITLDSLNVQGNSILRNILPENPDTYDLGSSINLWRKGWLSELDSVLFAQNTVTLLGGWLMISKNEGSLATDVLSTDTLIDFGQSMTIADYVVLRSSLQVEYIQVGVLDSGTTYNVVRDLDGSGANDWTSGAPFVVLGNTGDGRIELNAYDTPRIQMIQQGATYNQQKEIIRIGDLNGNWNYSSEEWGVAIGSYGSGSSNVTIDSINGVRINIYDTPIMEFKSTGAFISNVLNMSGSNAAIAIGSSPPSGSAVGTGLWLSKDGLFSLDTNAYQVKIDATDGKLYAGGGKVYLDGNGLSLSMPVETNFLTNTGIKWVATTDPIVNGIYLNAREQWTSGTQVANLFTVENFAATVTSRLSLLATSGYEECSIILDSESTSGNKVYVRGNEIYLYGRVPNWTLLYQWTPVYVSASSIKFEGVDVSTTFSVGTKIKFTQTTVKYFYVTSVSFSTDTTITLNGGEIYTVASATISSFYYSHAAVADVMPFGSSTFIPLTTSLTSTSWDGDARSTTAKTLLDLSAVFGVPAGVKAVLVRLFCADSASASGNSGFYFGVSPNNIAGDMAVVARPIGIANDFRVEAQSICPCNVNGDIYFQCTASGADTLDVWLYVWGYYI